MQANAPVKYRIIAGLIDWFIILLIYELLFFIVFSVNNLNDLLNSILSLFVISMFMLPLLIPIINALLITWIGGTLGKLATGTAIVDSQGNNVSFKRAFFRNYIGYMVSSMLFGLGFIWIAIDPDHRGWHDQIADTFVVVKKGLGLAIGMIILAVLLVVNIYLLIQIYNFINLNTSFYQSLINDLIQEFQNLPTSGK